MPSDLTGDLRAPDREQLEAMADWLHDLMVSSAENADDDHEAGARDAYTYARDVLLALLEGRPPLDWDDGAPVWLCEEPDCNNLHTNPLETRCIPCRLAHTFKPRPPT